jgi:anti-sigma regulatory factor (Ser/Thr protein kinase)
VTDERAFPNTATSITSARRYTLDALGDIGRDASDAIAVMVSELVTNCVRHAATEFVVSIERDRDRVRIAVTDRGSGIPELRSPTPRDTSGRGLRIVQALADDWGVEEAGAAHGKTVWFTLRLGSRPRQAPGDATTAGTPALERSGGSSGRGSRDPATRHAQRPPDRRCRARHPPHVVSS